VIAVGHKVGAELAGRPEGNRPDGVFTVNDMLGIGLVQTLVTSGVRVPEDVAVVGYDDIEYAENSLVPLASIRPPHQEFGIAAVDLMLVTVDDGDPVDLHRVFAPELVVRRSAER
jgi:LacI family transcriptional regulator